LKKFSRRIGTAAIVAATLFVSLGFLTATSASADTYGKCTTIRTTTWNGNTYGLPAKTYGSPFYCWLGYDPGNENDAVYRLQLALRECENRSIIGWLDGYYGANTETAVRREQEQNGISADGAYGPATRDVIRWPSNNGCSPYRGGNS
jgi:peptidoglycan hydrolase-like protein with peptidoglycan-binding domain